MTRFCRNPLFWLLAAGVLAAGRVSAASVKVACLGDSITWGAGLADRERASYPPLLERALGSGYVVANFGVGGATMLREGDKPYVKQKAWREALAFRPDIAVIILGTNDTVEKGRRNWSRSGAFRDDAAWMIRRLREVNKRVRILLCSPPDMRPGQKGLSPRRSRNLKERRPRLAKIREWLREAAVRENAEFVDLWFAVWGEDRTIDGVHPTPLGVKAIVRRLSEAIETEWDDSFRLRLPDSVSPKPVSFHGYRAWEFRLEDALCRAARPVRTARGAPWIWRARFWDHQPQADLALLERGFHVAYCDVSNLYGAPQAVERWNRFYAFMRRLGFDARPFLEGMSRGGLIIHNWAAANPRKVSGLYGDNPVLDIRSWPGGFGKGKGSPADWRRCMEVYGLSSVEEVARRRVNPLDRLEPLARAGAPILYILGMADTVVPPAENAEIAVKEYRRLGRRVEVIRKPGMGHHPHSLPNPQPIVDFVLRATGRAPSSPAKEPAAARPDKLQESAAAPSPEGLWFDARFRYEPLQGLEMEEGVTRRDPSDIIRWRGKYYLWYTKTRRGFSGYNASIWQAVSSDGRHWREMGEALPRGKAGAWDAWSVFTPNILKARGKFYLFYTGVRPTPGNRGGVFENNSTTDITAIGVAVADSPEGPFRRVSERPVLEPASDPSAFDSYRVDDACLIFRERRYWLYYKGRSRRYGAEGPLHTRMGVAVADRPEGPYVKSSHNPLTRGGHEVMVWPFHGGVMTLLSAHGPDGRTLQYAPDGLRFAVVGRVGPDYPKAPGAFRAGDFADAALQPGGIEWGVSMNYGNRRRGVWPHLLRYEIRLVPAKKP